jgi:hypothetical protein
MAPLGNKPALGSLELIKFSSRLLLREARRMDVDADAKLASR